MRRLYISCSVFALITMSSVLDAGYAGDRHVVKHLEGVTDTSRAEGRAGDLARSMEGLSGFFARPDRRAGQRQRRSIDDVIDPNEAKGP